MIYPKKKKRPKMGVREPPIIKCRSHTQWVRNVHQCAVFSAKCIGKNHAHHVTTKGAGGGDETVVPLCTWHHSEIHTIGIKTFEAKYAINLTDFAALLWKQSRHRLKHEASQEETCS